MGSVAETRKAKGFFGKARCLAKAARHAPAAARELTQGVKELVKDIKELRSPTKVAPVDVGSMSGDRSPLGCYDMAGNVSEWVRIPKEGGREGDEHVLMGGNADSTFLSDLAPARKDMLSVSPKLMGFRTVLLLKAH